MGLILLPISGRLEAGLDRMDGQIPETLARAHRSHTSPPSILAFRQTQINTHLLSFSLQLLELPSMDVKQGIELDPANGMRILTHGAVVLVGPWWGHDGTTWNSAWMVFGSHQQKLSLEVFLQEIEDDGE
jgi:hypothetical protein